MDSRPVQPEREGRPERTAPPAGPAAEAAAGGGSDWVRAVAGRWGFLESLPAIQKLALKEAKLKVKPETWILKAQQIGVCLSVENAIGSQALKRIFESFEGAEVKVLGTVLLPSRMCVVLHLGAPVDYSAFETQLKKAGLKIDDLVWGHWKYGWGIEGKGHDHRHDTGVLLKPRKQP